MRGASWRYRVVCWSSGRGNSVQQRESRRDVCLRAGDSRKDALEHPNQSRDWTTKRRNRTHSAGTAPRRHRAGALISVAPLAPIPRARRARLLASDLLTRRHSFHKVRSTARRRRRPRNPGRDRCRFSTDSVPLFHRSARRQARLTPAAAVRLSSRPQQAYRPHWGPAADCCACPLPFRPLTSSGFAQPPSFSLAL